MRKARGLDGIRLGLSCRLFVKRIPADMVNRAVVFIHPLLWLSKNVASPVLTAAVWPLWRNGVTADTSTPHKTGNDVLLHGCIGHVNARVMFAVDPL